MAKTFDNSGVVLADNEVPMNGGGLDLAGVGPTQEPGQRSITYPPSLSRMLPYWGSPDLLSAENWRRAVRNQPVAVDCRDTLIMNVNSLEWLIEAKDASKNDDYKKDIDYYTDLIQNADGGYLEFNESMLQNYYDIPFGAAAETIREGDRPDGKVLSIKYIDAATLWPTFNTDYPVIQNTYLAPTDWVVFPKHAIVRLMNQPRPELIRRGWGMAPPERIYLALEMLYRGDRYYANLLLDTPEAGILDLGDVEEDVANKFLDSWKAMMTGIDPLKVPVLFESPGDAHFISFTRPPSELMFDKARQIYSVLVAAGYGISLEDIGDTTMGKAALASSIRSERRTKRTGIGIVLAKMAQFWNHVIPPYLRFKYIDRDDEQLVSKGRARLANALAMTALTTNGVLLSGTARRQLVQDGLITVATDTDEVALGDGSAQAAAMNMHAGAKPLNAGDGSGSATGASSGGSKQVVRQTMGDPKPASSGGEGEVTARMARKYAKFALRSLGKPLLGDPVIQLQVRDALRGVPSAVLDAVQDEQVKNVRTHLTDMIARDFKLSIDSEPLVDEYMTEVGDFEDDTTIDIAPVLNVAKELESEMVEAIGGSSADVIINATVENYSGDMLTDVEMVAAYVKSALDSVFEPVISAVNQQGVQRVRALALSR